MSSPEFWLLEVSSEEVSVLAESVLPLLAVSEVAVLSVLAASAVLSVLLASAVLSELLVSAVLPSLQIVINRGKVYIVLLIIT